MNKNLSKKIDVVNIIEILLLCLLILFILYYYWQILYNLFKYLINNDDYSYGLLIPVVSGFIIYLKWPQIRQLPIRPSWGGLVIIVWGLSMNIIGELAADIFLPRISFIITLSGILILLAGWSFFQFLIFPLFILILMIPLPELITNKLTLPLQLISSQLAANILQLLGIPVFRQGNIIDLGVRQMQIVDACSGLRYILALLALGVIFCYFYQRKPWKIMVLLLILIPSTILANAFRVAGMGIFPALLEGFWHAFSGWLIFLFCFVVLALVNSLLNRISPPEESGTQPNDPGPQNTGSPTVGKGFPWAQTVVALVIIGVFIPISQRASIAPNYPLKQDFKNFPMTIGPWQGRHAYIDPDMVAATKSHAHLNAEYLNPEKGWVSIWIAYYETQKKAGGFVHSPKGCFTATGWQIEQTKIIDIADGKPVNWMVVNRNGEKLLVYYWFSQRGRWLADETINKFFMAYDGFTRRRTDGALIRLITPVGSSLESAQQRLTFFAQHLSDMLKDFIPD